jgi:hypothetical protein
VPAWRILDAIDCFLTNIFRIAQRVVDRSVHLTGLTLMLRGIITAKLPGNLFRFALDVFRCTFDMFLVHIPPLTFRCQARRIRPGFRGRIVSTTVIAMEMEPAEGILLTRLSRDD